MSVNVDDGRVSRSGILRGQSPLHARGEVVLECAAPAPDGGLVRCFFFSTTAAAAAAAVIGLVVYGVNSITILPLTTTIRNRSIPIPPTSPPGPLSTPQPIRDKIQQTWRIPLHNIPDIGVNPPQLSLLLDIPLQPLSPDNRIIRRRRNPRLGDPGPRCERIRAPRMARDHVEEVRICGADPGAGVVLVGDGVDAEVRAEKGGLGWGVGCGYVLQGLDEGVGAAPDGEVEGGGGC